MSNSSGPRLVSASLAVVALFVCRPAWGGFPELIRRVPSEANAIVVIDADRLFASPMAQRDGWKKKQIAEYAQRPLAVPPRAEKAIRAARVDLQAGHSEWELMLIEIDTPASLDEIARREKGYVDKIANAKAVWSPRGAYVVSAGQNALGVLFPPNRQFLARWLKQPSGKISDYLLGATQSMSATDAQVLLALDLEDAIEPQRVQGLLKQVGAKNDSAAMAAALESLRGAKFEIIIKDKPWGRLMLEFGNDPAALVPVVKTLVIDTLDRFGAALDDLRAWKVDASARAISLHGELSGSALLRLGSLLELPSLDVDQAEESVDASNPMLYATQNHFKAVSKLLDDLLAQKRDAKTYGQLATWIEQYAKRIDRLPLVNVDPDMQQYSAGVAEDLRQIASSIKGAGIRTGMQTAGLDGSSSYGWGNYDGYFGNRQVDNQRRAIRAQERGASNLDSGKLADQIRADKSNMRRLMTQRYKVEF